jgi:large subunit ribosomal protein L4
MTETTALTANLTLDVLDPAGEKVDTIDLPAEIFAVQTNVPLIHQVVVAQG